MELKKTPFYQRHLQDNGRIVDFSGWALPVEYKSMLQEAKAVRTSCGLFDVTHMGEILVKGRDALEFLQRLTSNDIFSIVRGQMQYNFFLNARGGIIDDLMVYHQGESLLCVVNASNKDKVLSWLRENQQGKSEIIDKSDETALISVQGPCSSGLIERVFGRRISGLEYLFFIKEKTNGKEMLISRSGYTGEDGFEIYMPWEGACYWWDKLREAGGSFGLVPCGLGSRDILRIEAGYPLYGYEIDNTTNPYEASLGWAVKLNKDFVGKEEIMKAKNEGLKKKRVGFIMQEKSFSRQGYPVYSEGKEIGVVCSGTYSPNIGKFIGMAYVEKDYTGVDTEIGIMVRGRLNKAKIAKFPFLRIKTKKGGDKNVLV